MTGTGKKRKCPPMVVWKEVGKPETDLAFVRIYTRERRIAWVPRVMIKGGSPVPVTRMPFKTPIPSPNSTTPTRMANTGEKPKSTISFAVKAPDKAIIEEILKSMPPSKIAKNSPTPSRI